MIGVGTHIYSIIFIAVAGILGILEGWYLIKKIWIPAFLIIESKPDAIIIALIKTFAAIAVSIVVLTLAWNVKQSITTTASTYKTPAEINEQKKIQESVLPEQNVLDKTRVEQKEKSEVKPHQDALDSFDKSMEKEADKIRQRNSEKQ